MRRLQHQLTRIGRSDATVLIVGESGTGKELIAARLHEVSRRASKGRYLALNCGAVSPNLIESELFGHEKGSFTGAVAPARGLLRARARRHAVPRRNHGDAVRPAGAPAARAGEPARVARRLVARRIPVERARDRRHQPRSARGACAKASCARTCCTGCRWCPSRCRRCACAAATCALLAHALPRASSTPREGTAEDVQRFRARAARGLLAGRATCASSTTRCSAPSS